MRVSCESSGGSGGWGRRVVRRVSGPVNCRRGTGRRNHTAHAWGCGESASSATYPGPLRRRPPPGKGLRARKNGFSGAHWPTPAACSHSPTAKADPAASAARRRGAWQREHRQAAGGHERRACGRPSRHGGLLGRESGSNAPLARHVTDCLGRARRDPWRLRRLSSLAQRAARVRHPQPLSGTWHEASTIPPGGRTRRDSAPATEKRHFKK